MIPKVWDERYYLFDQEEIMSYEDAGRYHKEKFFDEKIKYEKALEYYDKFIDEVAKLLRQLGYSSGLECANMISYLIKNGFLSINHILKENGIPDKKEINYRLGTSIVRGSSNYRNYVNMFNDICNAINLETDRLYCYAGNPKDGLDKEANYAINLVPHDLNIYGFDAYCGNRVFKFDSSFVLVDINQKETNYLLYKPYLEIDLGERKFREVIRKINSFDFLSKRPAINYEEYEKNIKNFVENKMDSYYPDLCDFYEDTMKLKKRIIRKINTKQR